MVILSYMMFLLFRFQKVLICANCCKGYRVLKWVQTEISALKVFRLVISYWMAETFFLPIGRWCLTIFLLMLCWMSEFTSVFRKMRRIQEWGRGRNTWWTWLRNQVKVRAGLSISQGLEDIITVIRAMPALAILMTSGRTCWRFPAIICLRHLASVSPFMRRWNARSKKVIPDTTTSVRLLGENQAHGKRRGLLIIRPVWQLEVRRVWQKTC